MKIFGINFAPLALFDRKKTAEELTEQRRKHEEKNQEWHKNYRKKEDNRKEHYLKLISLAVQGNELDVRRLKAFIKKTFKLFGDTINDGLKPLLKEVVAGHLDDSVLKVYFGTHHSRYIDRYERYMIYGAYKDGKISRNIVKKMLGKDLAWKPDEMEYNYLVSLDDIDILKTYVSKNHPKGK